MLAHSPFTVPLDYQDLLKTHDTADEAIQIVQSWLPHVRENSAYEEAKYLRKRNVIGASPPLHRIKLGEFIAENEKLDILDYFITTAPYINALNSTNSMIYVGRKGSGKTANLIKIADEVQRNNQNHLCVIKPIDYELEGVLRLLNLSLPESEKGFLVESLWKFLVYTELAQSVYAEIIETGSRAEDSV